MSSVKFDLVIYGATGFTGKLAAQYVSRQYANQIRWAVAGRSRAKLESVKQACAGIPDVLVADSDDQGALDAMVAQTKVVVTFAGPFARYGNKLVAACVAAGVDYCDITGEMDWVRENIARYDDAARKSGAHIVSLCGHDSLPWDLMTLMLSKKLREGNPESDLARVDIWDDIRSAPSGGTLETAFDIMFGKKKPTAPEVTALGFDPLLKTGVTGEAASSHKVSAQNVAYVERSGSSRLHSQTRTFFVMAGCNASAVKRSNALNKYGTKVVYREGRTASGFVSGLCSMIGLSLFGLAIFFPPTRYLLRRFALPKPGEGPSEESMAKGYLVVTGAGTAADGRTAKARLGFPVDPGYKDTARMAVECGLTLALDGNSLLRKEGGVYTPGACQGEAVLSRLLKTGSTFDYV